jgi:hypothetical protein
VFEDAHDPRTLGEGRDHPHPTVASICGRLAFTPSDGVAGGTGAATQGRRSSTGGSGTTATRQGEFGASTPKCIHAKLIGVADGTADRPLDHNNCDPRLQQL